MIRLNEITFYPAVFRVAIGLILVFEILTGLCFIEDLYAIDGFDHQWDGHLWWLSQVREYTNVFLLIFFVVVVLWLLGIGKQFTSLLVFIFYSIDMWLLHPGVFWGDHVLHITLLFFVFVDSFTFFALRREKPTSSILSKLAVLAIMVNLCLIYLENAYFKLSNPEWQDGYALAYFFEFSRVLDIFQLGDLLMQYPTIIRLSTWSVLLFQLTVPFMLWNRKLKFVWIAIGVLIHLLMAVTLQLYKFELIIILLYGFFVTDKEWQWLFDKLNLKLDIIHGKR